jgi:SAM-dependent methyltransferase
MKNGGRLIQEGVAVSNYMEFSDRRLVALYDTLNPFGEDSEFFCKQAEIRAAKTIIDLGCGTGLLTVELAKRGHQMTGIEPSEAMLAVARAKPYADQIKWIQGSFERMDGLRADMVLMTSHVAQFFLDDSAWRDTLQSAQKSLSKSGHLVFDVRRLTNPPFAGWPTEDNRRTFENTPAGAVEWWFKLLGVENKRVRYELHYFFVRSGEEIVSVNELMFRSQDDITEALSRVGFEIETIYGNWDGSPVDPNSPEMIFVARSTN